MSIIRSRPRRRKLFRPVGGCDRASDGSKMTRDPIIFFFRNRNRTGQDRNKENGRAAAPQTMVEQDPGPPTTNDLPMRAFSSLRSLASLGRRISMLVSIPVHRVPIVAQTSLLESMRRRDQSDEFFRPSSALTPPSLPPPLHSPGSTVLARTPPHLPSNHAPPCLARRNISLSDQ